MSLWKIIGLIATGLIVVIVLAAVLMRADRIETRVAIHIDAPPVVVWEVIADPEQRTGWMENVTSAARMTGTLGEPESTMMLRVKVGDFNLSVFEKVVGSGFPDFIRTETTDNQGELSVSTAYFLEVGNPGTDLEVVAMRSLEGSFAAYFAPFIRMRTESALEADLVRLKAVVEQAR